MTFNFHAAPPAGEWINDPNGLVFADGRYRLFVQHSAAAPEYRAIGWARLSSDDLLHWDWDGSVIPPDASGLAYSGSIPDNDAGLTAWLTRHRPGEQRQFRLTSSDAGRSWTQHDADHPARGRNVRDPFVFDWGGERRMLLAEPCDWTDWATDAPSTLSLWREAAQGWARAGTIGPWSPAGVMWEVPVLLDFGAVQVLLVSTVDRRGGGAQSSVRYWTGRFDGSGFVRDSADAGTPLDHGPDFYAACVNTVPGWPDAARTLVGWASSWATARSNVWPGAIRGGPISLPRRISLAEGMLRQQPLAAARPRAARLRWAAGEALRIDIAGKDCAVRLEVEADGTLDARRSGGEAIAWQCREPGFLSAATEILLFNDCGLIEFFFESEGKTMTIYVPEAVVVPGDRA